MGNIVKIDEELCIGCGACTNVCKGQILTVDDASGKCKVGDESKCQKDGACMAECPSEAIKVNK